MEAKWSGCVNVLPVRHKQNSQRINVGLHDANLSAYQSFLFGRGSEDCVAVCGSFRRGCFCADPLGVPFCLSPAELRKSQQEENCRNPEPHLPPPGMCWRRTWGWSGGNSMDGGLIEA